jgi:hypothetical protein
MCAWLTDCEFIRGSQEKGCKFERKKAPNGSGVPIFGLADLGLALLKQATAGWTMIGKAD